MKRVSGMRQKLVAGLLTVIAVGTCSQVAFACSCDLDLTTSAALSDSTAVFEGTVVAVDHRYLRSGWLSLKCLVSRAGLPTKPSQSERALAATRYSFRVEHVWKGVLESPVVVMSDEGNCSCRFDEGTRYLVFATAAGSELTTNVCMGTAAIAAAQETLAELRRLSANAEQ